MSRDDDFRANLALGRRFEVAVADWLKSRGWYLMPDYAGMNARGAPSLRGAQDSTVLPDILAAGGGRMRYYEVKYRTRKVRFRKTRIDVTGKISERLWRQYLKVQADTGVEVWIVFYQKVDAEIVGAPITRLDDCKLLGEGDGAGEIYIPYGVLQRLVTVEEIRAVAPDIDVHPTGCTCADCFWGGLPEAMHAPRSTCRSCGAKGQPDGIHAPGFVGPLGYCVPCFRREWAAGRTPAWISTSEHGPKCTCAVCFDRRLAKSEGRTP